MTKKERAITNLKQMCSDGRYLGSGSYAPLEVLEDFSTAIKALEQEPRKGHWNDIPKYKDIAWQCSECEHFTTVKHNYCSNCGADMREVEE